jgi:quercetin dioxygenase-like cupin family protein
MRNLSPACLVAAASCARDDRPHDTASHSKSPIAESTVTKHTDILPDQIKWQAGPPSLPPGAQAAILEGDPDKAGPFTMRLKSPAGYVVPPHTHPTVERLTVIAGTTHLGTGATLDKSKGLALPAGSYTVMPAGMQHYAWSDTENIVQLTGTGPWKIDYVNPADDPRKK